MNLRESLRVAVRGLASNKMRTALTMLGVIIGVAVVILVVAIGEGAARRVTEAVNSLGTNLLTVTSGRRRVHLNAATAAGLKVQSNRLRLEDSRLIAQRFTKTIAALAPEIKDNVQIRLGNKDASTNLIGTSIDYPYVTNSEADPGRFFTADETDGTFKVCVLGTTVAEALTGSPDTDLTGQTIEVNHQGFKVVGMLAPKGAAPNGQDQDDVILVPVTTAMRRLLNKQYINAVAVRCVSAPMMPLAEEQVASFLRNRHHLQPPFPDNDDFNIRSQTELMERQQSVTNTMTSLLSAVAIISLIVGGIGIMNIMLVSVTERTREIGIRKAIGATPRDILLQFLIESAIIALIGGLIGIGLGVGGAILLAVLADWATIVSPTAVAAALLVSAAVGLFFGIYPASRAAALHPIEALRYE
jgi:putative ABC transport system permease protein